MPRLDSEYAHVSDDRYVHIYMLISCFHPKNNDVRRDLVPQIVTYTYYVVSCSLVQLDDGPVTKPKHVVVFHTLFLCE